MTEHYGKGTAAERGIGITAGPEAILPHAIAERIAKNRGPVWPTAGHMVVEVVEVGTRITAPDDRPYLEVDDENIVQKGSTLFVTQRHWDLLILDTKVRRF